MERLLVELNALPNEEVVSEADQVLMTQVRSAKTIPDLDKLDLTTEKCEQLFTRMEDTINNMEEFFDLGERILNLPSIQSSTEEYI